jgi:hypothetical protein
MPSTTRRRALHGAAALLAGVAGCSGESSSSSGYPSEATGRVAVDPASYRLRNPDRGPVVWTGPRPTTDAGAERRRYDDHFFVARTADAADAADVSVADVPGADGARGFLADTDYDDATVYVEQWLVGECFTPELCHVRWSRTDIDTSYSRRYRDVDVACGADARDTLAVLIRLPEPFDPSEVSGYGSSRGSASCERRNERVGRRRDGDADR